MFDSESTYFYPMSCGFIQDLIKYTTVCAVHMVKVHRKGKPDPLNVKFMIVCIV